MHSFFADHLITAKGLRPASVRSHRDTIRLFLLVRYGLGNLAAADVDQLTAVIKYRLKCIHYRPALIDAFLAQTGLQPQLR